MKTTTVKDDKLKPLLPSLRFKKRFIKIRIESDYSFSFKEISEELINELILLIGAVDLGKSGFWILRDQFDSTNKIIICRVTLQYYEKITGAINLISKLKDNNKNPRDVALRIKKVSGTLRGVNS